MHTIELRNGSRLAYRDQGEGPVMLLVHGWGVSGELFDGQLSALSDRFRVIVPDLPGHGASGVFPAGAGFGDLADAVAELISELQLRSIALLGWSLGAMVVWDLLARHPESDIAALITVDMVPRVLNDDGWNFGLREGRDYHAFDRDIEFIHSDWPGYIDLMAPRLVSPGADQPAPHLLSRIKASAIANHAPSMAKLWELLVEQDFREFLPRINIPTLVITGGRSALYSVASGQWVARQIPAARFEVFEGGGHAPHLDQPQRFNQLLAEFVSSGIKHTAGAHGTNKI